MIISNMPEPVLHLNVKDQERFQDMDLMLFDKVVCFDNYRQKIVLIINADAANLDESYPAACGELERLAALRNLAPGYPVWKAFKIRETSDINAINNCHADLVILDNGYGAGVTFNWSLASGVTRPYLLAGGLTSGNIPQAIA